MSRAFVKEDDDAPEELPERPISTAPNLVTARGLEQIDAEIARLTAALQAAGEDDRDGRARLNRDLRYWNARRGSAQLMQPPADRDSVHFGSTVTIDREDGRRQKFQIVGEDEADPEAGTISHVSPLARALMGKGVGGVVNVAGSEAEIVEIC
jgi:transcription elongation GreA/GreB family factor